MAAKIGILGESTIVTVNTTTTLYTVPADKAARVKVLYVVEAGAGNWAINVMIGSPGNEITLKQGQASGQDGWTGFRPVSTPDPATSNLESVKGVQAANATIALENLAVVDLWFIEPLSETYYLSTGDTVRVDLRTTAAVDLLAQVIGVEDDA